MVGGRRRRVLRALVEEYIATGQPVGSKHLVERHELGCSPATVRNVLAALEETGYVYQPHVSAGRVPTDAGYRAFVDELLEPGELRLDGEAAGVRQRYVALAGEVDELMRETSALLSRVTHYVAVVMAPTLNFSRIRRVDLVGMAAGRVLVVVITEQGEVVSRQVSLTREAREGRLAEVEQALNTLLDGKRASEVRPLLRLVDAGSADTLFAEVLEHVLDCLEEADRDRLYHVGVPELLDLPEFADAAMIRPLLTVLEDGLVMLEALSEVMRGGGLTVRIGSENTAHELEHLSLVATRYGSATADGIVGVIGPKRMDYSRSIAAVHCAADGLSEALGCRTSGGHAL
ncbi:MAG TPA: heat-inducible transcriptional repressor HrcA [Coriobacteriia bacterium]|nr:heat-inducible transcriptional repressor HrcA [Coriobacteriia bacterium]